LDAGIPRNLCSRIRDPRTPPGCSLRATRQDVSVWRLAKSRGLFFERTGMPASSFWATPPIEQIAASTGRPLPAYLTSWNPKASDSQSNCPIMHELIKDLGV
jgi:hypothetical protein